MFPLNHVYTFGRYWPVRPRAGCFEASGSIVQPAEQGFANTKVLVDSCSVTQLTSSVLACQLLKATRPNAQEIFLSGPGRYAVCFR